jgi:restriction system protein
MAVPPYTDFMLPTLELLADGKQRSRKQIAYLAADKLGISDKDRSITLPNSPGLLYKNRSAWAVTYLFKAGLLNRVERGQYTISERGRDLLRTKPPHIDLHVLSRYPEFLVFHQPKIQDDESTQVDTSIGSQQADNASELDPQQQLETAYVLHRQALAEELLDRISAMSPKAFESLVVILLLKMGYGGSREDAGKAIGQPNDEGVDGVIKEDRLGLDLVYLQAKRWQNVVGRDEIQKFVGSLAGKHAHKGVFITTSYFSQGAIEYARNLSGAKVVLIDGEELSAFCIEFGVGVQLVNTYAVKKIDSDFFGIEE